MAKVSGIIRVKIDGEPQWVASDDVTYNIVGFMREDKTINSGQTVFMEKAQTVMIEGEVQDRSDFDVEKFCSIDDATITLDLGNGKTYVFYNCFYCGETNLGQKEGNLKFKFASRSRQVDRIN